MSYIDEKVAPKREERLGACAAVGSKACELKEAFGGSCRLQDGNRSFCQGSICQLLPGAAILNTIPDSVLIVHGSIGCGGAGHNFNASLRSRQMAEGAGNPRGTLWLNTNLNERDVVSGGEEKLEQAILEADRRYRPASIIVLSSCVPGIIGDDIDGVAARLQPQVHGTILPVHCEGFKTKIMATAYDAIYHSIARNLLERPEYEYPVIEDELFQAKERIRRSKLVNLLNVSSMGDTDERELTRLLNMLGLKVNIYPCHAHPDDIKYATEAAVSISTCPTHDDYFIKHLKEEYGVPYILHYMPIGIENTNSWLRQIADFFGLQDVAEKIIARENEELLTALEPLKKNLRGKQAMLSAGEVRTLATATYLLELGMEISAVRPYHLDQFGQQEIDKLAAKQAELPVNVSTAHPFEAVNLVAKTKPDVYIGHCSDTVWAAKMGIPSLPIYGGIYTYMGYTGAFDIARRIDRVLKNPSFNKNLLRHVRQPYVAQWFKDSPYKYISGGGEFFE